MKTPITKGRLRELVREVLVEESEYQAFFAKALEKAGKTIPSMSDEEKKAFFDKIDAAWNGKGEKKENTNEMSGTAAVAGYNTPAAFSKNASQEKKKDKRLAQAAGYEEVKSESKMNELEFDSKEEMDAYKKAHNVRPGTELKLAPITKRVGHAITKGAEKVGDKVMNTVGKALYTTKVGNAAMKGIGHASNAVTKKMGLDNMNDKESDAEVDAWKDYYKKK